MEIKVVQADDTLTHIALAGKLDVAGEGEIGDMFRTVVAGGSLTGVIVDMAGVTYLASLGIRMLFEGAKALAPHGKKLVVVNPQGMVEETLRTSGTVKLIPIAATPEEAKGLL
ncbi:MAG: STAS domain-containing protein [Pseudomonadota bacterium]